MSSLVRLFRSKRNSANKENDPLKRSTLDRSSFQGDLERIGEHSLLEEHCRRRHLELAPNNPYSVMTAPKTTRGPRSCPGGVQVQREGILRTSQRYDRHVDFDRSYSLDPRMEAKLQRQRASASSAEELYDYEAPRRDPKDERINALENKLARARNRERRMRDEMSRMSDELNDAREEEAVWRKRAHHYEHKCEQLRRQLETEHARLKRTMRELQNANIRVSELEGDSGNETGLAHPGQSTHNTSQSDCGNSCLVDEHVYENEKVRLRGRAHMIDDEISKRISDVAEEAEQPRDTSSALQHPISRQNTITLRKSSSDTDLVTMNEQAQNLNRLQEMTLPIPIANQRKNMITPHRRRLANEPYIGSFDETTSASSEDERYALISRQLRHKGDVVRYVPRRTSVSQRHFKPRFNKWERDALSEFAYLMDLSSDVSGLVSSPETRY